MRVIGPRSTMTRTGVRRDTSGGPELRNGHAKRSGQKPLCLGVRRVVAAFQLADLTVTQLTAVVFTAFTQVTLGPPTLLTHLPEYSPAELR